MKKKLNYAWLAWAVLALAGGHNGGAQAAVKNGFYVNPTINLIFIDKNLTKGLGNVGFGGGGGLGLGYQINNFLIDFNVDYQYHGGDDTVNQITSAYGTVWLNAAAAFNGVYTAARAAGQSTTTAKITAAKAVETQLNTNGTKLFLTNAGAANGTTPGTAVTTTIKNSEEFIPVTLGVRYLIPLMAGGKLSITPGIAGGLWIHTGKRDTTHVIGTGANAFTTGSTDNAIEAKAVVVPSLSFDYAPLQNLTISLSGKFYIVPGGYGDSYLSSTLASANATAKNNTNIAGDAVAGYLANRNLLPLGLPPTYTDITKTFWYGGINLGVQYTF
ncbi:MAG: hypothetical protein QM529_04230 [Hydrotalea sp.]|nr:hypothetical protein [Hydrotalea sp.]